MDQILIKANYYEAIAEVMLTTVVLDSAAPLTDDTQFNSTNGVSVSLSNDVALSVEMCQCPPNYQGTSCEARPPILLILPLCLMDYLQVKNRSIGLVSFSNQFSFHTYDKMKIS